MESLWQDEPFDTIFTEIGACFNFWPTWNFQGQWRPSWKCHNMWYIRKMLLMLCLHSLLNLRLLTNTAQSCHFLVLSSPTSSGGLYRGDVSETLGTCLIWSGRSSWAIWYLSFKNPSKNETVRAKKRILGWGYKGGLEKNGCAQILFISKASKIHFMSWDTDLGPMSPFPLINLHIRILSLGKRYFWSILGGCMIFFFWLSYNPLLWWKF